MLSSNWRNILVVLLSLRTIWNFVLSIIVITQKAISSYHWPAMSSWMTIKLKWCMLCRNFNSSFQIEMRDQVQQVTATCIIHILCNRVLRLRIHLTYNTCFKISVIRISGVYTYSRHIPHVNLAIMSMHVAADATWSLDQSYNCPTSMKSQRR